MNNTLVKGLGLLEVLAHSDRALGVTELATRLGIGKSNAHRLLQALVELGYARRDGDGGTYAASIRLWELGSAVLANLDLRRAAQGWMDWLLDRSRETVHLSVLDGDEVVYVHKLDSPEPVRAYTQIGGRAPAYCVATGKAMLAWLDTASLDALSTRLVPASSRTITEPAEFLREMERVRQQGYAINRGEWRETVGGIAAPVRDPSGRVVAAVGLSGPIERLRPSNLKALSADVIRAAEGVGTSLAGGALAPPRASPARRVA
ncbi:MAG: IclR family transcriptional regulator [Burkholderiales bacterium]|jgi:DNA-binding IclR family transcriptional regulator